jgi:outer membrane immunogenic protein
MYFGFNIGRAWGDVDFQTDVGDATATSYFDPQANADSVAGSASGGANLQGTLAGLQIGALKQSGNLVYGLEADFGAFNLSSSKGVTNFAYPVTPVPDFYTVRASVGADWLATARARVGWTTSNLLIYATGGLALSNLQVSNSFSDTAPSAGIGSSSRSETVTGWTLGGGLEMALGGNWSLKGEYLYVDLGSVSTAGTINCGPGSFCAGVFTSPFATSADVSAHIARVGLNHRF